MPTCTVPYEDVRGMLTAIALHFSKSLRTDYRELIGICYEAYADCTSAFDPGRGEFRKFLSTVAYKKLIDHLRKERRWFSRTTISDSFVAPGRGFMDVMTDELSDDARELLAVLIDPPDEALPQKGSHNSGLCLLRAVRGLLYAFGWGRDRVREAVRELREVLS